ncbi:MAG: hypothetical protein LBV60_02755 [Streptomyces sp.]|jgi:hypothetical protein|nr:hypothetical protein [Streptomyces sp.]
MTLRLVLGTVFAAMAAGQFASFIAMPGILDTYQVTGGAASAALVVLLIGGAAVAAAWLLGRPRSTTRPVGGALSAPRAAMSHTTQELEQS